MEEFPFKKYKKKPFFAGVGLITLISTIATFSFLAYLIIPNYIECPSFLGCYTVFYFYLTIYYLVVNFYFILITFYAVFKSREFKRSVKIFESSEIEIIEKNKRTNKTFCGKCGIILNREAFRASKKGIKPHYFNGFKGYYCKNCFKRHGQVVFTLYLSFMIFIMWYAIMIFKDLLSVFINSLLLFINILEMLFWYKYYKKYT